MKHYCAEAIVKTLKPKRKSKIRISVVNGSQYLITTDSTGKQIAFLVDGIK